ncbi:MAG: phosphoglycerate kinase [Spirochaetes bacterium]|nr:phosphoglycerate kinase [Spirochaetota bacterium]
MAVKYIDQINIKNKRVMIRVDYNVPYDKELNITDDTRISATIPTLEHCIKENAKVILVSHLGRPDGKVVPKMSLKPVADRLSRLIKKSVVFIDKPIGEEVKNIIANNLKPGDVALLENIRFYPEEEKNDDGFGKKLAELADVYVNDAFAAAHRGHASNEAVTRYIKECAAGFLLKDEIEYFKKITSNPERPLVAVIGGAKVSSKLEVLKNFIDKVDFLIIGGGMAFTFLKAKGFGVGKSILENDLVDTAKSILSRGGGKIILPVDTVIAAEFKNDSPSKVVPSDSIPDNMMGLDIGPKTIEEFGGIIKNAKTLVWNGPVGAFEMSSFAKGTMEIGKIIAESKCISVVGGGDSVTAVNTFGLADKMSYISTGGGAFLELLEGKILPAIAALDK